MKKIKKYWKVLFLAVIGLILIINLIFFVNGDKTDKVVKEEPKKTAVKQKEVPKEKTDPLAVTKEAIGLLYREKITPIGQGEEYPSERSGILKEELLDLAKQGDYGKLLEHANSLTEQYSFSKGDNLDIAGIIYDTGLVADNIDKSMDKTDYGTILAGSKTPEMLVSNTIWADNFARRSVIEDTSSIAPVGIEYFSMSKARIYRNVKEAVDEPHFAYRNIVKEIFTIHQDVNAVYVYDLELTMQPNNDNLPVTAYVWEDLYGAVHFYGLYVPDDTETYAKNLEWWMQHDNIYEQAEKEQDKNNQQNAENDVITEEQIDQLFESGW